VSTTLAQPTLVTLVPDNAPAVAAAGTGFEARPAAPLTWNPDDRRVQVGAGQAVWLVLRENENRGWGATLGGKALVPVSIDGWEQGFLVPAGSGGVVTLTYRPDRQYRAGLVGGGVLALGVCVVAFLPGRRRRVLPVPSARQVSEPALARRRWPVVALGCAAPVLVGGLYGLAMLVVVGGVLWWARRQRHAVDLTRGFLGAGLAVALLGIAARVLVRPVDSGGGGLLSAATQIFGLLALAMCVAALVEEPEPLSDSNSQRDVPALRPDPAASAEYGRGRGRASALRVPRRGGRTATPPPT
jgi:arabinofuranan 3-O-arabinosyltransferase